MKISIIMIIFIIIFFTIIKISFAKVYYVNNNLGNDVNSGTNEAPLRSIASALKKLKPGDTVIIISNDNVSPYQEDLHLEKSGTAEAAITIQGESDKKKPIIKGKNTGNILSCYGVHHVHFKNLIFQDTKYTGLAFVKGCSNITLSGIDIYDVGRNGIVVTTGHDFVISNCIIRRAVNSGIALMGSKNDKLTNTFIENCIISDILTNDGITLHKDGEKNDIGSHHIIQNTEASNCGEQGIDITSGSDILVENNYTYQNHDSGIVVGHNVSHVDIINHRSVSDGKYDIIVLDSIDVLISKSFFKGPVERTLIQVDGCQNLMVENSYFVAPSGGNRQIIDIGITSKNPTRNLIFKNNIFMASEDNDAGGVMLRYLQCSPDAVNTVWDHNKWFNYQSNKRVFYDADQGKFNFDTFKKKNAQNDTWGAPDTGVLPPQNIRLRDN